MQIQMIHTMRGSSDGFTVQRYMAGQTYDTTQDIGHSLACQFLARKRAVQVNAPTIEGEVQKLMDLLAQQRADRLNADRN